MSIVLDASATLAFFHEEELTPAITVLFDRISVEGAFVPSLWRLEVGNILQLKVRRERYDAAFRDEVIRHLSRLPIHRDDSTDTQAWGATLQIAEYYSLTLYDSAYLELAIRRGVPLATLDRQLRAAASLAGVDVLGL